MKILQVTNHFWPCKGGVERSVEDLCTNLIKKGHSADVMCLNQCWADKNILPKTEDYNNIKITRLKFADLKYYKIATNILQTINKINPDVIHLHGINYLSDYLLFNKRKHKIPLVFSTHGGIFHTQKLKHIKKIYFNNIIKSHLKNADKIIAVSENDEQLFSDIVNSEKIKIIENSIDLSKFSDAERKSKNNSFVFVGRLSNNKRIDLLIDVFAHLKNKDFKLTIVGKDFDNIENKLKRKVADNQLDKKILFKGEVSEQELFKILKTTEFFISASEYEGFGISAIEAMASGLIPILNNIPSFRTFVTSKQNGVIIDFSDIKNAAMQIEKILNIPKTEKLKLSKNAIQSSKKYSWKNQIKKFEKIYCEVTQ